MFNKRYQVLLSDWMEDYLQFVAERYDSNMSSAIRAFLCLGFIKNISMLFPEYKTELDSKDYLAFTSQIPKKGMTDEEGYRMMSKILFEARKAVDYRFAKEKKKKK